MKIYLAGPLFTTPERTWNEALAARLEAAGHEVFVPHHHHHPVADRTAEAIFRRDLAGVDWADAVVAIMEGRTPTPARRGNAATPMEWANPSS